MRGALAVALLAGCPGPTSHDGQLCETDAECGSDLCARDGECLPASQLREVKITWTINGMTASATTCAGTPDLYLQFDSLQFGDTFGFAPVPCMQGSFNIDRLPKRFDQVELGVEGGFNQAAPIDANDMASFDLHP